MEISERAKYAGLKLRQLRGLDKQVMIASDLRKRGLNISQGRISALERGKSEMSLTELQSICDYFGVDPGYFFQPETVEEQIRIQAARAGGHLTEEEIEYIADKLYRRLKSEEADGDAAQSTKATRDTEGLDTAPGDGDPNTTG